MEKQALLLRIGADTYNSGTLAPIFEDGTWYYIPIPESNENTLFPFTYQEIPTPDNRFTIGEWLPKRIQFQKPHFDPEFWMFTYGEPIGKAPKIKQLTRLSKGDLLLFTAGLVKRLKKNPPAIYNSKKDPTPELYLIGMFEIEDVKKIRYNSPLSSIHKEKLSLNAHALRRPQRSFLSVRGNPDSSFILKYPLKLTANTEHISVWKNKVYPRKELIRRGLKKISYRSMSGNWVPENALSWLLDNINEKEHYPLWISSEKLFEKIYDSHLKY